MRINVIKLDPEAQIPDKAHSSDAGFDLYANESGVLSPGEWRTIQTGIALELPENYAALVLPRSGLSAKHGIGIVNSPGLIDSGYRGEVGVVLHNGGKSSFHIEKGMRFAQLLFLPLPEVELGETTEISSSDRGSGGFGSSGN